MIIVFGPLFPVILLCPADFPLLCPAALQLFFSHFQNQLEISSVEIKNKYHVRRRETFYIPFSFRLEQLMNLVQVTRYRHCNISNLFAFYLHLTHSKTHKKTHSNCVFLEEPRRKQRK